jgi:hypothetical protein
MTLKRMVYCVEGDEAAECSGEVWEGSKRRSLQHPHARTGTVQWSLAFIHFLIKWFFI